MKPSVFDDLFGPMGVFVIAFHDHRTTYNNFSFLHLIQRSIFLLIDNFNLC